MGLIIIQGRPGFGGIQYIWVFNFRYTVFLCSKLGIKNSPQPILGITQTVFFLILVFYASFSVIFGILEGLFQVFWYSTTPSPPWPTLIILSKYFAISDQFQYGNYILFVRSNLACATDKTQLKLSPSAKQHQTPCSAEPPPVYWDLSTCHDWPVKKAIVDLPTRLKGNSKRISSNSLIPQGTQVKDIGTASQMLLTGV